MVNEEIKSNIVNVVSDKGLIQMSLTDAINLAEETDDDVVVVNNKSEIPVVKIMNYSKYLYDKQKKEKENKKKNKLMSQDLKEIHISDSIAEHDMCVKAKAVDRILKGGDKVKLLIRYKGRQIRLIEQGPSKLQNLANKITSNYRIDVTPKIEGNKVFMIISPEK